MKSYNKKTILFATIGVMLLSVGISQAFAQTSDNEIQPIQYVITFASFGASGILYSASGWIKKIRKSLSGESIPLDYAKMGKSIALGMFLAVGAFAYSAYSGDVIQIANPQQFFAQIGINTSAILIIDKWILGRSESGEIVKVLPPEKSELRQTPIPEETS